MTDTKQYTDKELIELAQQLYDKILAGKADSPLAIWMQDRPWRRFLGRRRTL